MTKPIEEPKYLNMREVYLHAISELANAKPGIQLKDWDGFTYIVGGFRPREFSILCGPTGCGKTAFLANISAQLIKQGERHFVMSVETGHTDYLKRVMSVLVGKDLNTGEVVSVDTLAQIHTTHAKYLESDVMELSLYEDRTSVEQLMSDIRYMVKRGCKIAMIDNLNFFMEVTRASDQIVEMDRVIHELIMLCKQVDIHIIMVMHPRKTDGGRIESEFDIKGSSTAVQEAHNVFLLNRPTNEEIKQDISKRTDRELKIAKMRKRGIHVGKTIIFKHQDSRYIERGYREYQPSI